jgi:hypothetical protein
MLAILLGALLYTQSVNAHVGPFAKGMYCINGPQSTEDLNSYQIIYPLYQRRLEEWWMHHIDNCDNYPPPEGEFLDLPAGGSFTVDMGSNRAKTRMAYNGQYTSDWPDGGHYPENYHESNCIISPNLHTENQSMAAGTAFAISYQSDIKAVTQDNLVVFTVLDHSPWKRVATYQVPAALPACPPKGCHCAWGWVPNGCGQPNMYQQPFRCRVTGATSTTPVAKAKPPVWCEDNPSACVKGAKQMVYWNQLSGNNINVEGWDKTGRPKSPGYNMKLGFAGGAQNDIFAASGSNYNPPSSPAPPSATPSSNTKNTTTTPTKPNASRRCKGRRSTLDEVNLEKKSSFVQGIASHLKRRRAHLLL